ncbi:MAG: hypothetical protein HQM08_17435 [Candidatus Riflebacteria bacterium]|nr:hypothetical protein [Candidatus Riflebacteria bacterium]
MSFEGGTWTTARWGGSLWGYKQAGVSISATIQNAALSALLAQANPSQIEVILTVLFGSVDLTRYIETVTVETGNGRSYALATIVFIGGNIPGFINSNLITVKVGYRTSENKLYTGTVFRGTAAFLIPRKGRESQSVTITAYGGNPALDLAPANSSWSGSSFELAVSELGNAGVTKMDLDFTPMTLSGTLNFSKKLPLIMALAEALEEAITCFQFNGTFTARKCLGQTISGWKFPLSCQFSQGSEENSLERYNQVTVTGSTGNSNSPYNDTDDQVDNGVLPYIYSSSFPLSTAQCLAKAISIVNFSILPVINFESILNPWIKVGTVVEVQDQDTELYKEVLITDLTSRMSWVSNSGFWTNYRGKVLN